MGQTADSCTVVGVGPSAALQNCTPRGGQEGRCWTQGLLPGALGVLSRASSDPGPLRGVHPASLRSSLPKGGNASVGESRGLSALALPSWLVSPEDPAQVHCSPLPTSPPTPGPGPLSNKCRFVPSAGQARGTVAPSQGPLACWLTNPTGHSRWLPGAAGQAGPWGRHLLSWL